MTKSTAQNPLNEFRAVYRFFEGNRWDENPVIVHVDELPTFLKAVIETHYYEGTVNSVINTSPSKIKELRVSKLEEHGPYWWTTPGLKESYKGTIVYTPSLLRAETVWICPRYKQELEKESY